MRIQILALAAVLVMGLGGATVPVAPEKSPKPLTDKQIQVADLKAQQSMALSAHSMLIPTYLQLILGLAGTLGLFATIYLTRRSIALTRESLDLTRESLAMTRQEVADQRDLSQRQLRAFVTVKLGVYKAQHDGERARLSIDFTNHGATPAHSMMISASLLCTEFDETPKLNPDALSGPFNLGAGAAQDAQVQADRLMTSDELARMAPADRPIKAGESALVIVGVASYKDAFDEVRKTQFGYRIGRGATGVCLIEGLNSAT